MGNPDLPTPQHIVDKLVETVSKPRTHRYSASKGIPGLRRAQAAYYERRFGVKLDPETQIVATLARSWKASPIWRRRSPRRATSSGAEPDLSDPSSVSCCRGPRSVISRPGQARFLRLVDRCKHTIPSRWRWCSRIRRSDGDDCRPRLL
jgi:hypothetical protein